MIRPFTALCMVAAGISGLYLYQTKHRAELLDRQIIASVHVADQARERIGILRAEWALLNQPERLQALSTQFLTLRPMAPTQFVQISALDARLPTPRAAPPVATPAADDPAPVLAEIDTKPVPADPLPAPPPPPAMVAAAPPHLHDGLLHDGPPHAPPATLASHVAAAPVAAMHPHASAPPTQTARNDADPASHPAARSAADPQPVLRRIMSSGAARGQDMAGQPVAAAGLAHLVHSETLGGAPMMASALGAARMVLAPPVPISAAEAASLPGMR